MDLWRQLPRLWARLVGPSGVVALGLVAHYGANALALLVLARRVLPVEYGQYTAVLALVTTSLVIPVFGLDTWLLTRGAASPPVLAATWRRVLILRTGLLVVWAAGILAVGQLLPSTTYPTAVLATGVAAGAFESLALMTLAALRSRQDHGRVALVQGAWAAGVLLLAVLLPLEPGRLVWFTAARAGLAALAAGGLAFWMAQRPADPTGPTLRSLLTAGRAYFVSEVAVAVYMRGDVVLTGLVLGAAAAAVYGPAINIMSLAYILPNALFYAATPALSHAFGEGASGPARPAEFRATAQKQLLQQVAVGLATLVGLWVCAPLAGWIYGPGYADVVWVLRLLAPIGLLRALNFGLGAVMIAAGRQAVRARIQLAVAACAIGGNLAMMPWLGVAGVAGVFVVCELLLVLAYGRTVWQLWRRLAPAAPGARSGSSGVGSPLPHPAPGMSLRPANHSSHPPAVLSMQILIVNVHSARNLGDVGIMQGTLALLRQRYPGAHIAVAANDPLSWLGCGADEVVSAVATWLGDPVQGQWRAILWRGPLWGLWMVLAAGLYRLGVRWRVGGPAARHTQRIYYAADLVLSCGGGNFYAARPASPALWAALAAVGWALALGKPVRMLPQSLGPVAGGFQRGAMRALLRRVPHIWVREPQSLAFARDQLGLGGRVELLPDLALGLPPVAPRPLPPGVKVGFCVMDRGAQHSGFAGQADYERSLVEVGAALCRDYGAQIYLVAQVYGPSPDQDDRRVAARLSDQFRAAGIKTVVCDTCASPAEVQAVYAALDLVVATRMHAAIFALTCGVPVIALGYQPKSCGLMGMIGLGDYCLPLEQATAGELLARATRILADPTPIRRHIARTMQDVRARLVAWEMGEDPL